MQLVTLDGSLRYGLGLGDATEDADRITERIRIGTMRYCIKGKFSAFANSSMVM